MPSKAATSRLRKYGIEAFLAIFLMLYSSSRHFQSQVRNNSKLRSRRSSLPNRKSSSDHPSFALNYGLLPSSIDNFLRTSMQLLRTLPQAAPHSKPNSTEPQKNFAVPSINRSFRNHLIIRHLRTIAALLTVFRQHFSVLYNVNLYLDFPLNYSRCQYIYASPIQPRCCCQFNRGAGASG